MMPPLVLSCTAHCPDPPATSLPQPIWHLISWDCGKTTSDDISDISMQKCGWCWVDCGQDLWSTMQCITLVPSFVSLLTADLYDSCISLVPFYPICFPDDVIVDDVGGQEVSNLSLLCPLLYHSCITLPSSYLPAGHLYSQPTIGHFRSDWDKIFVVEILQNAINDITQTFTRILIKETKHIWQVSVPKLMFQRSWMIFVRQEDRFGKSLEWAIPQVHYDIIKKPFQPL